MYVSKRVPREKQRIALDKLRGERAYALLMAMRVGKTKVVVDDWGEMVDSGEAVDLLVIAPGGAYLTWWDAVGVDLPSEMLRQTQVFAWVSGKANTKAYKTLLRDFMDYEGPRVFLVNVEAIGAVRATRDACLQFLRKRPDRAVIAVDESVVIKNVKAEASKFVVDKLAPVSGYRRILTGLVAPRSPIDVYQQFRFLDKSIFPETFAQFRDRYTVVKRICRLPDKVIRLRLRNAMRGGDLRERASKLFNGPMDDVPLDALRGLVELEIEHCDRQDAVDAIFRLGRYIDSVPMITAYRDLDELNRRIAPYSYRVRLEDCYDMPPSDYSFRYVEMTTQQKQVYDELKAHMVAELEQDTYVSTSTVITNMLRLHQVLCGHTVTEDGVFYEIKENRTAELVKLLDDYDGKAIIWCSYDHDVRKVHAALEKHFGDGCAVRFWGGNRKTREDEEKRFKEDPSVLYMVATPDAGGRGRAWDVANLVVYYSSKDNLDHREQSEERAKAVGKTTPVAYVDMIVRGTVEEYIIGALRKKINLASTVVAEEWRRWLI